MLCAYFLARHLLAFTHALKACVFKITSSIETCLCCNVTILAPSAFIAVEVANMVFGCMGHNGFLIVLILLFL